MKTNQNEKTVARQEPRPAVTPSLLSRDAILAALRPEAHTQEAIRAALAKAVLVEEGARATLETARGELIAIEFEGTSADVADAKAGIVAYETELGIIQDYRKALEPALKQVKEREEATRVADARQRVWDLVQEATRAAEAFKLTWERDYPAAAAKIVNALQLEADAIKAYDTANRACSMAAKAGVVGIEPPRHPTIAAVGRLSPMASMGTLVRLPGALGAPNIPIVFKTKDVERIEEYYDYDAPGPWSNMRVSAERPLPPLRQRMVMKTESVTSVDREDTAFWWPR